MKVDIWDELLSILKTVVEADSDRNSIVNLVPGPEPAIEEAGVRSCQFHTFLDDVGTISITISVQDEKE